MIRDPILPGCAARGSEQGDRRGEKMMDNEKIVDVIEK